jgi:S-adenosylmethionine hydrolase
MNCPLIALFTDFGSCGPYVGQMKAAVVDSAPGIPVVDLMHDVPVHDIASASYLLAAVVRDLPRETVVLAVVDPGVGTENRLPAAVRADGRWFVGPGNGLFSVVVAAATSAEAWRIDWRPDRLSASFHGRDLFAPVAARIASGDRRPGTATPLEQVADPGIARDLDKIVYIDRFGNAMTGRRAETVPANAGVVVAGRKLRRARTFDDVPAGTAMWYANSSGLVEVAVNQGRADVALGLAVGTAVTLVS